MCASFDFFFFAFKDDDTRYHTLSISHPAELVYMWEPLECKLSRLMH